MSFFFQEKFTLDTPLPPQTNLELSISKVRVKRCLDCGYTKTNENKKIEKSRKFFQIIYLYTIYKPCVFKISKHKKPLDKPSIILSKPKIFPNFQKEVTSSLKYEEMFLRLEWIKILPDEDSLEIFFIKNYH